MKKFLPLFLAVMIVTSCPLSTDSGEKKNEGGIVPATSNAEYVVFAWNDLGMHCLNPTYDIAVILPPFNTIQAQVVKRGAPPQLVDISDGISVEFRLVDNTSSHDKGSYGQFWSNLSAIFGVTRADDVGLGGLFGFSDQGLTGTMDWDPAANTFRAEGIPVVPVNDSSVWSPYQQAIVTVKNGGTTIAETRAMVPTSDEINCAKCHAGATITDTFNDILGKHDANVGTNPLLINSKPVLCASCHGSPALGTPVGDGYLSKAVHGFHSSPAVSPQPTCYDCHPGTVTKCSRSTAHSTSDGNCTSCHGSLANVASTIQTGRIPWADEPACGDCHKSQSAATLTLVDSGTTSTISEVDTAALYRNSAGHGGLTCSACHTSPHAMVPSREARDNYQALAYQGKAVTVGSCAVCHSSSRGEGLGEFMGTHGGANPEHWSACAVCHTSVPSTDTNLWPHKFQWRGR